MDALTFPRLKARLQGPALARRLSRLALQGGEVGRLAAEQLGQASSERPPGPLLWIHAPEGIDTGALGSLVSRLSDETPDVAILLTAPESQVVPETSFGTQIIHQMPPLDLQGPIEQFLGHWTPDTSVWVGLNEEPILLESVARLGISVILQDARAPDATGPRARLVQRRMLGHFERILAITPEDSQRIRALGPTPARIEATGALTAVPEPPDCPTSEVEEISSELDARPIWLASLPPEAELDAVFAAHEHAQRSLHRLLLIIIPPEDRLGSAYAERVVRRGWSVARRNADEDPGKTTDVYIADRLEDVGLAYRLAPVTYLGGSISGTPLPTPMDPATLGSAIITGPAFGDRLEDIDRLRDAGACRVLWRASDLGAAVLDLLAPDSAALLALKAWEVASEGALVLDRLVGYVTVALRERTF